MAGFKTGISKLYARARDRPYTSIYTKQGRTDKGLRSSVSLKNRESGNSSLRWATTTRIVMKSIDSTPVRVTDKLLERSRVALVRKLGAFATKEEYLLRYPVITHHILRHHGLATGGSAGRVSTGMSHAFGTGFMLAANLKPGQNCIEIYLPSKNQQHVQKTATVLRRLRATMPFKAKIVTEKIKKMQLAHESAKKLQVV